MSPRRKQRHFADMVQPTKTDRVTHPKQKNAEHSSHDRAQGSTSSCLRSWITPRHKLNMSAISCVVAEAPRHDAMFISRLSSGHRVGSPTIYVSHLLSLLLHKNPAARSMPPSPPLNIRPHEVARAPPSVTDLQRTPVRGTYRSFAPQKALRIFSYPFRETNDLELMWDYCCNKLLRINVG